MEDALRILWMTARGMTPVQADHALRLVEIIADGEMFTLGVCIWCVGTSIGVPELYTGKAGPGRVPLWQREIYLDPARSCNVIVDRWNENFDITLPTSVTGD